MKQYSEDCTDRHGETARELTSESKDQRLSSCPGEGNLRLCNQLTPCLEGAIVIYRAIVALKKLDGMGEVVREGWQTKQTERIAEGKTE
jgi:hypothetical protein